MRTGGERRRAWIWHPLSLPQRNKERCSQSLIWIARCSAGWTRAETVSANNAGSPWKTSEMEISSSPPLPYISRGERSTIDPTGCATDAGWFILLVVLLVISFHFLPSRIFGDQPWFNVPGLEEGQPLDIHLDYDKGIGTDPRVTDALLRAEDPVVLQEMALRPGRMRKYLSVDYCDDAFIRGPTAIRSSINLAALLPDMPRLRRKLIKHIATMNGSLGMEPFGHIVVKALPRPLNVFKMQMANLTERTTPGAFHRMSGSFERMEGHLCVRLGLITGDMKARQKAVGAYAVVSRVERRGL